MSRVIDSHAFYAEEIRDTGDHNSIIIDNEGRVIKTLVVENGLNQQVTFQCKGSANSDFSKSYDIGSEWSISASTNTYQTCDSYHKYWRIVASCTTAPTSGDLTIHVLGVD